MTLLGRTKRYQAIIVGELWIRQLCLSHTINCASDPGTFQQYALAPANYVTPIPDALSSEAAAPMLCAGVTT
jgi:D-arabinose 1-dehydrogenase-like Zn-dependent alcohol dehydrogenase